MTYTRKLRRKAARALAGQGFWGLGEVPRDRRDRPWPADDPGIPNEPTEAGRRMGHILATLADRAYQEREGQPLRQRCRGCALRHGTLANGCEEPLMDIIKAVIEIRPFHCHMGKEPRPYCAGVEALWGSEAAKTLDGAVRRAMEARES